VSARLPLREVQIVQNPALGSTLLWRFGRGLQERTLGQPGVLPFFFLVLPVCLFARALDDVLSTRKGSGLRLFSAKVGENREELIAIHERALALRELTWRSLVTGVRIRSLKLDCGRGEVRANDIRMPDSPERLKPLCDGAERLGYWCGGVSLKQAAMLLQVTF